jgi:hypothetical protein
MTPKCPRCNEVVTVTRATFLMADHSMPPDVSRTTPPAKRR